MPINAIFNETELTIFFRQTHFSFGDFYKASDGMICAVDQLSRQVFVGDDLSKSNVHAMDAVESVKMDEDHFVRFMFKDSSTAQIKVDEKDVEVILAELQNWVQPDEVESMSDFEQSLDPEQVESQEESLHSLMGDSSQFLSNEDLNEVYSRLLNTGRSKAMGYLVSEVGMGLDEANKYLDMLDNSETMEESVQESACFPDGTMRKNTILSTLKELRTGDRIHLEYKPLIGKLHVYDTEYRKLSLVTDSRYFSLSGTADDFPSLLEDISSQLYDYLYLVFFCPDNYTDISCRLSRVKVLKKLQ